MRQVTSDGSCGCTKAIAAVSIRIRIDHFLCLLLPEMRFHEKRYDVSPCHRFHDGQSLFCPCILLYPFWKHHPDAGKHLHCHCLSSLFSRGCTLCRIGGGKHQPDGKIRPRTNHSPMAHSRHAPCTYHLPCRFLLSKKKYISGKSSCCLFHHNHLCRTCHNQCKHRNHYPRWHPDELSDKLYPS